MGRMGERGDEGFEVSFVFLYFFFTVTFECVHVFMMMNEF